MIPSTTPPSTVRQLDTIVATDRAIPGRELTDRAAATSRPFTKADPEPVNRRGRRHLASEIKRTERSIFRSRVQRRLVIA